MSRYVRTTNDNADLENIPPSPPEYHAQPLPRLRPVPQNSLPSSAPSFVPPPAAPPTEAAKREALDVDLGLDEESVELVSEGDDEYFPTHDPAYPPAFVTERSQAQAARLAEAGLAARRRKEQREPLWPEIIPGTSSLKPVPVQEPSLKPVPK